LTFEQHIRHIDKQTPNISLKRYYSECKLNKSRGTQAR